MSKSKLPARARLGSQWVDLCYPSDSGYIMDIANVWLDDEYGLKKLEQAPEVIVDIGGNIGLFSLWAWSLFPRSSIYTYEPNSRVINELKKNLSKTSHHICQCAVGSKSGFVELQDLDDSRLASTHFSAKGTIEVRTLSQIVEDVGGAIDLLKIDCEGAEWDIFNDRHAFKSIKSIRMEYHLVGEKTVEDLQSTLESLGYRMTYISQNNGFGIAWFEKV